jgi:hypothetical protein
MQETITSASVAASPSEGDSDPRAEASRRVSSLALRVVAWAAALIWATLVAWRHIANLGDLYFPLGETLKRIAILAFCVATFARWGSIIHGLFHARAGACPRSATSRREDSLVELGLGSFAVILLVVASGFTGILGVGSAWAILLAPWAVRPIETCRFLRDRLLARRVVTPRWSVAGASLGVAALLTFVAALAPETSQDALVYHLAVPQKFIEEGRIHHVEGNFFSAFPMNVEMLFTLGLILDGDSLAKSFHWLYWLGASLATAALARRIIGASDIARRVPRLESESFCDLAAALIGTLPTAALIAGWAYVDMAVVFYTSLSVLMLVPDGTRPGALPLREGVAPDPVGARRASRPISGVAWACSAAFAAAAAGCKYTALLQGILLGVYAICAGWRSADDSFALVRRRLVVLGVWLAIGTAPWLLENIVATGNPLFPFAYGIFGGEGWDSDRAWILAESLGQWGGDRDALGRLLLPWDVSVKGRFFSPEGFDGVIGWAFLAGVPLIALGARRSSPALLVSGFALGHALAWAATTQQVRFLLPALALAAPVLVAGAVALRRPLERRVVRALGVAAVLGNVSLIAIHFASHRPLGVVLGLESRERYLDREVPAGDYAMFRFIEEHLPEDAKIFFASCGNPGFLCKRKYYADAFFENFTLNRWLGESSGPDELRERFAAGGFSHILFRTETVFDPTGKKSEIPLAGQIRFAEFLNRHAVLETRVDATVLYRLRGFVPIPESAAPDTHGPLQAMQENAGRR